MKPIIYVAHPVTGDPVNNAHRTIRWVKKMVIADPARIYIAPWVAEVLAFGDAPTDPAFYQRVLDDDCEVVAQLRGGVFAVGGKWGPGMLQERATARICCLPVLDFTKFTEPSELPEGINWNDEWARVTPGNSLYVEPY